MIVTSIPLAVTAAGTPQQFTTDTTIRGFRIDFSPKVGNTKRSVVGNISTMNKGTLAGCIAELPKVAADGISTPFSITSISGIGNPLRASDYWGDSDFNGESILMVIHTE